MSNESISRRDIVLGGGAAIGLAYSAPLLTQPPVAETAWTSDGATLRQLANAKGLLVGSAVRATTLANDPSLRAALRSDCNILVPENELKFGPLKPAANRPAQFDPAEQIYAFANANGMKMRGHTLLWWEGEPEWARVLVPTLTAAAAGNLLTTYIQEVVGHWRGRLLHWDVVNEPIDAHDKLLETLFTPKLGEQVIDLAYRAAHEADPAALLVLNQTGIEQDEWWPDHQRVATLRLLERLLKRDVPVQALGVESHLTTKSGFSQAKWRTFLDEVTGMGLKVIVTELDVSDAGVIGDISARDAATAALATAFLDVTLSYRQCLGVLNWGLTDRYAWLRQLPDQQRKDGAALRPDLLDENYHRKPLWRAVAAAIKAAPTRAVAHIS